MDESSMRLHPGYRFNPFEKEVINFYLKPKVMGEKLSCNVVEEKQLYGPNANPWQVFDPENHPWIISEVSPGKFEKIAYVFVNLTKKAANPNNNNDDVGREQFIKKAGCGTWDGKTKRTEIMDSNGHLIGEKRMLVFEINEVSDQDDFSRVGYWKMHEYNLCGVNKNIPNPANTVLCKITLDYSKNPPVKLRPNKAIHPIKPTTSKPQKKNNNNKKNTKNVDVNVCSTNCAVVNTDQEEITENCVQVVATQTCRDDGLISIDSYGPNGEEYCYETDIVQTCDDVDVEWMNNIFDHPEIGGSLLQEVDSGPMSFDLCCPATYDDGYQIFVSEEGEGGNSYVNMTGFRSYPKPRYEHPLEDFTANLGKRKFHAETSYALCTLLSLELNKEHFFKKLEFIMTLIWIRRDIAGGLIHKGYVSIRHIC